VIDVAVVATEVVDVVVAVGGKWNW